MYTATTDKIFFSFRASASYPSANGIATKRKRLTTPNKAAPSTMSAFRGGWGGRLPVGWGNHTLEAPPPCKGPHIPRHHITGYSNVVECSEAVYIFLNLPSMNGSSALVRNTRLPGMIGCRNGRVCPSRSFGKTNNKTLLCCLTNSSLSSICFNRCVGWCKPNDIHLV